ncbi:hypothetical protein PIB30_026334 [Stylosanthes scabra]|uniref:Retrotransposon Copia-like N-terminal domain-containing protein n=1 Tax=Stylosanthes scabra TaxID=79078 RepID=A0ABU6Y8N9_9FABA|nr:hypothetical protein [Stylosanthes scabra]
MAVIIFCECCVGLGRLEASRIENKNYSIVSCGARRSALLTVCNSPTWYPELEDPTIVALLVFTRSSLKNGLVPLADKLDDNNFSTWQKSVLLTLRTLKLIDHLSHDKVPPQYEETNESEVESGSVNNSNDKDAAEATPGNKKTPTAAKKIIQESQRYLD